MRYKRNDSFMLKSVADDYILIAHGPNAVNFSSVVLFNETGVFLWKNMDVFHTPEELAALLVKNWAVQEETAIRDVQTFINNMLKENLVIKEEV